MVTSGLCKRAQEPVIPRLWLITQFAINCQHGRVLRIVVRADVTHAFLFCEQQGLKFQRLSEPAAAILAQDAGEGIVGMLS